MRSFLTIFCVLLLINPLISFATESEADAEKEVEQATFDPSLAEQNPEEYFTEQWRIARGNGIKRKDFIRYAHINTGYKLKIKGQKITKIQDAVMGGKHFVPRLRNVWNKSRDKKTPSLILTRYIDRFGEHRVKTGFSKIGYGVIQKGRVYLLEEGGSYTPPKNPRSTTKKTANFNHLKSNLYSRNNLTTDSAEVAATNILKHDNFNNDDSPLANMARDIINQEKFLALNVGNAF